MKTQLAKWSWRKNHFCSTIGMAIVLPSDDIIIAYDKESKYWYKRSNLETIKSNRYGYVKILREIDIPEEILEAIRKLESNPEKFYETDYPNIKLEEEFVQAAEKVKNFLQNLPA